MSGRLYLDVSKKQLTKCILFHELWHTPLEFEASGGRRAKQWKQTLTHLDKPLGVYDLSCTPSHISQQTQGSTTVDTSFTSPTSEHVGVSSTCNSSVPLCSENVRASSLGAPSCNPQFLTNPLPLSKPFVSKVIETLL